MLRKEILPMKEYEAPKLTVQDYAADTLITSSGPKNGQAGNNQNCWADRDYYLQVIGENVCTG